MHCIIFFLEKLFWLQLFFLTETKKRRTKNAYSPNETDKKRFHLNQDKGKKFIHAK
jgi:hypothetical protein